MSGFLVRDGHVDHGKGGQAGGRHGAACEVIVELWDMGWSDHALNVSIMAHRVFDAYVGLAGEGVGALAAQARQVEPGGRCASGDLSM